MSKISVICCTARKEAGIKEMLKSLEKQTYKDFEFVLVDKAWESRDEDFIVMLNDTSVNCKYIKDKSEHGFVSIASARNLAVDNSSGEWIVSVDDRTLFYSNTLELHAQAIDEGWDAMAGFSDFHHEGIFADKEPDKEDKRAEHPNAGNGPYASSHFYGYHMGFSKKAWAKVRGFDETYDGVYGWEDVDFGIRLGNAGAVVKLGSECRVLQIRDEKHDEVFVKENAPHALTGGHIRWRNDRMYRLTLMNKGRRRW